MVQFADFKSTDDECAVLGYHGALQYFLATFDGEANELTLIANQNLPKLPGRRLTSEGLWKEF